jgi:hypothetical protein
MRIMHMGNIMRNVSTCTPDGHADAPNELLHIREAQSGDVLELLDVGKVSVLSSRPENVLRALRTDWLADRLQIFEVGRIDVYLT